MVLDQITYFPIFGIPLTAYIGIITLALITFTAFIAVMNSKGNMRIKPKWHPIMARISLIFAFVHGVLSLLSYF